MNLSHRTERGHDRAVSQAAAAKPADLPDMPQGAEEWLAAKMAKDAKTIRQTKVRPKHYKCGHRTGTAELVLGVLDAADGPITSRQISEHIDRSPEAIRHGLIRLFDRGVVKKHGPGNKLSWSKV